MNHTLVHSELPIPWTLELPALLQEILEQLKLVVPLDSASILLKQGERLAMVASCGFRSSVQELSPELLERLQHVQGVLHSGVPDLIGDTRCDPRWYHQPEGEYIRSWIGIPLLVDGETIGIVNIDSAQPGFYTENHVRLALAYAQRAAAAIENTRLVIEQRETKERLQALISSSFDAIIAIDPQRKITVFNRQAELLLGYSAAELLGKKVSCLYKHVQEARKVYRLLRDNEVVENYPVELVDRQGNSVPVLLSSKVIRDDRRILGQVGYLRDQRAVKLLETRLRAVIEAAKAINSIRDLPEVLVQVIATALRAFPNAERGSIHIYDEREKKLVLKTCSYSYSLPARQALGFRPGEGVAGWVYKHAEPVVIEDGLSDRRYKHISHPEIRSHRAMICTPLRTKEKIIGVLTLSHLEKTGVFEPQDLGLLASFADQASIAIENALTFENLKNHERLAEALVQASRALTESRDISQQTEVVRRFVLDNMVSQALIVGLYDEDLDILDIILQYEKERFCETGETSLAVQENWGLCGLVVKTQSPLIWTTRNQLNSEIAGYGIKPRELGFRPGSGLVFPLEVVGKVLGVISIQNEAGRDWSEAEINTFGMLASLFSVAVRNARLYGESIIGKARLQSAFEASHEIISTRNPKEALQTIVDCICTVVDACQARVVLLDEQGNTLELARTGFPDSTPMEAISTRPDGISAEVARSGVARYIPDTLSAADQVNPNMILNKVRAAACLPLNDKGRSSGVLWVHYAERHVFTQSEKEALSLYSNLAAIAYGNARLLEEYNAVNQAALQVSNVMVLGEHSQTLQSIVSLAKDTLHCDIVTLYDYDDMRDKFAPVPAMVGVNNEARVQVLGYVARHAAPYLILKHGDVYYSNDSPNDAVLGASPFVRREGVRASAGVPLMVQAHPVGVMFVNYRRPHTFTDSELATLRLFANHAAISIQNARLYQAQQEQATVLEALNRAGQAVASSLDRDQILKQIAQQTYELSGYRGRYANLVLIALVEGDEARFVATYPEDEIQIIHGSIGERIVLKEGSGKRIGITGRVIHSGVAEVVLDVLKDEDYLCSHPETRSSLYVPIRFGEHVLGVIGVEYPEMAMAEQGAPDDPERQEKQREENRIVESQMFTALKGDLEMLAANAAIAIYNARQYALLDRQYHIHEALNKAGEEITRRITAPRGELLKSILKHSTEQIRPAKGSLVMGVIQLVDKPSGGLSIECVLPEDAVKPELMGRVRVLDRSRERVGLSGRAFLEKKSQLIPDVKVDPEYLVFNPRTQAELDVPLMMGDEVLGVISLESDQAGAFDELDQHALESLAELAVITIENARRYQMLKGAQAQVGAMTAVTFMGKVESTWRHNARNLANAINTTVVNIQNELRDDGNIADVNKKLETIKATAAEIMNIQMPPLSSEEGVESVRVNLLLRDRVDKLKKSRFDTARFKLNLDLGERATVRCSSEWLRRVIDILIENGVQAAAQSKRPQITISTRAERDGVEILVQDNGNGIPVELRPLLFNEPIRKKKGEKGSGLGLFLAWAIVQTYGGDLSIRESGPGGTTMATWFPLEK